MSHEALTMMSVTWGLTLVILIYCLWRLEKR